MTCTDIKTMNSWRTGPHVTCPASRHVAMLAEAELDEDVRGSLAAVVGELWRIRAKNDDLRGWEMVALANQATAQSYLSRLASAEALLEMAMPHVDDAEDECLAHMIRQHLRIDQR